MNLNIDKLAYSSRLLFVNPLEKFLFAIITLFLSVFLNSPTISILVLIINSFLLIYKAGIKLQFFLKLMLIPLYFLLIGTSTIAFNIINPYIKAIFSFNIFNFHIGITQASFLQAENVFFKAFAASSCLYFLILTTPLIDIISILRKLKIPELFLELMELIYRFIFILLETAENIHNSQNSRLGYSGISNSFKSLGYLISSLLFRSTYRANQLVIALESRGYTGLINVLENEYKFSHKNIFMIILFEIFLLTIHVVSKNQLRF